MRRYSRQQWILVSLIAVLCLLVSTLGVQAQEEIVAAGNGGTAEASANGGAVAAGDLNSGGNAGHAIGVGDTVGAVAVAGGAIANATSLELAADGGAAIADASGGDDNMAYTQDVPQVCVNDVDSGGLVCSTEFECYYLEFGFGLTCVLYDPACSNPFLCVLEQGYNCAPVSDLVMVCDD